MKSYFILIFHCLIYFSCKGKAQHFSLEKKSRTVKSDTLQKNTIEDSTGIVYLSLDNGITWKNASSGIPQKVSIGLGGIAENGATELGLATKEYGVFLYNLKESNWTQVPTNQEMINGNIGSLFFYNNAIYVGTQHKGIFYTNNKGKTWVNQNSGLTNLTIRRFFEFDSNLYIGTNNGFYVLDKKTNHWKLEYKEDNLQVNGVATLKNAIYIATNKGIYKKNEDQNWKNLLANHSVHNVSADNEQLYGMTYSNLLLTSKDEGVTWQKIQNGLPKDLYTFNVVTQNNVAFAVQWDGVYRKTNFDDMWQKTSNGLPKKFAATNLKSFNGILVVATSERKQ